MSSCCKCMASRGSFVFLGKANQTKMRIFSIISWLKSNRVCANTLKSKHLLGFSAALSSFDAFNATRTDKGEDCITIRRISDEEFLKTRLHFFVCWAHSRNTDRPTSNRPCYVNTVLLWGHSRFCCGAPVKQEPNLIGLFFVKSLVPHPVPV